MRRRLVNRWDHTGEAINGDPFNQRAAFDNRSAGG